MVGRDQFVVTVVWLATLYGLLSINGTRRKFIRPVHPVNACINVVLVGGSNFEDARYPFFSTVFFVGAVVFILSFLMLDG